MLPTPVSCITQYHQDTPNGCFRWLCRCLCCRVQSRTCLIINKPLCTQDTILSPHYDSLKACLHHFQKVMNVSKVHLAHVDSVMKYTSKHLCNFNRAVCEKAGETFTSHVLLNKDKCTVKSLQFWIFVGKFLLK